ncbi:MAG: FAD-dependent oxidoreductase [Candidatus Carbobacillus altaicus]|nr:FAD-dependent oxidoreductase [Candidatus Carbobacillus altaicus]
MLRTIPGLERAEMMRPGQRDRIRRHRSDGVWPSLMTKRIEGAVYRRSAERHLGYEEAAGQGLIAGINAARYVAGKEPVVLRWTRRTSASAIDDPSPGASTNRTGCFRPGRSTGCFLGTKADRRFAGSATPSASSGGVPARFAESAADRSGKAAYRGDAPSPRRRNESAPEAAGLGPLRGRQRSRSSSGDRR